MLLSSLSKLGKQIGKIGCRNFSTRKIFLDTETTGLNHKKDHILSICAKEIKNNKCGAIWNCFLSPGSSVIKQNPKAEECNGLDINKLKKNNVEFKDISNSLLNFIGNSDIICHNASFDIHFINSELFRIGHSPLTNTTFCTLKFARKLFPGKTNSLDALCDRFNIDRSKRIDNGHSAILDTELLFEVYHSLLDVVTIENQERKNEILKESIYKIPENKWVMI